MTPDQQWRAHDHGGGPPRHEHFAVPGEEHDHRPKWPPEALLASRSRRRKVPLWVRALEAWVEGQYPVGRHGYTEARAVVEQVILHYQQEAALKETKR